MLPAPKSGERKFPITRPGCIFMLQCWGAAATSDPPGKGPGWGGSGRKPPLAPAPPSPPLTPPGPRGCTLVWTMPGLWSRRCSRVAAMSISLAPATNTNGAEFRHSLVGPCHSPPSGSLWAKRPVGGGSAHPQWAWLTRTLRRRRRVPPGQEGWEERVPRSHADADEQRGPASRRLSSIHISEAFSRLLNHRK